jgi:hypothetical protein
LGLLKEPRNSQDGLAGKKRGRTIFDRVVRWRTRKAVKSKFQQALEREGKKALKQTARGFRKGVRDIWDEE